MKDIVDELKVAAAGLSKDPLDVARRAVDEIEWLREERKRLMKQVQQWTPLAR